MYALPSWTIHKGRGDYSPESGSGSNKNMQGQNRHTDSITGHSRSLYTYGQFKTARHTRMSDPLPPDTGQRQAIVIAGQTAMHGYECLAMYGLGISATYTSGISLKRYAESEEDNLSGT